MLHHKEMKDMISCTLVGDGMVGKTSLARVFTGEDTTAKYESTVFDNYAGNTMIGRSKYTVNIFDSTGEHEYKDLRCFSYKDSDVFVVCYSITDRDSFESVKNFWVPEIRGFPGRKVPVILVATHNDENQNYDVISTEEGEQLAKDIQAEQFVECSSLSTFGVHETFQKVAQCVVKRRKKPHYIIRRILGY